MWISWLYLLAGLALASFGARGFTSGGLPAGKGNRLTGAPGQMVGLVFVLMGAFIAFAAIWSLIHAPDAPPPAPPP